MDDKSEQLAEAPLFNVIRAITRKKMRRSDLDILEMNGDLGLGACPG